jgi:hypothetical protein
MITELLLLSFVRTIGLKIEFILFYQIVFGRNIDSNLARRTISKL